MNAPGWIREALKECGQIYQETHHPAAYTAQDVAREEHVSGHQVAKVVVVMVDGKPVELVLPASRKVLLESVRKLLGARTARLATEAEIKEIFSDCEVGALPPLRHGEDVPILMDRTMKAPGGILFQAGTHRDAIRMGFRDWFHMVKPREASFTTPAEPPPHDAIMRADVN
jgi:Ala-tRNA(Pro) deacylase